MIFTINNKDYEVIIEKKNNKNIYIRVKDDLKIYVTANYFVTKKEIEKLLNDNIKYIEKMLIRKQKQKNDALDFYYLGQKYDIILVSSLENIDIIDNKIYVKDMKTLDKWLKKEMLRLFLKRLNYNYQLFEEDIPFPQLKIRNMKTRWGVCNKSNKTVTLNSNLIKYSVDKLDYVIIHELSHFIHFDHSKSFWNTVSKYCPNYKQVRKELRD